VPEAFTIDILHDQKRDFCIGGRESVDSEIMDSTNDWVGDTPCELDLGFEIVHRKWTIARR
jgi:hypothetical protein